MFGLKRSLRSSRSLLLSYPPLLSSISRRWVALPASLTGKARPTEIGDQYQVLGIVLARARGLDLNNSPQSSEKCLEYTDLPSPGPFAASTKDLDYCITRVRDVLLVPSLVEHLPVARSIHPNSLAELKGLGTGSYLVRDDDDLRNYTVPEDNYWVSEELAINGVKETEASLAEKAGINEENVGEKYESNLLKRRGPPNTKVHVMSVTREAEGQNYLSTEGLSMAQLSPTIVRRFIEEELRRKEAQEKMMKVNSEEGNKEGMPTTDDDKDQVGTTTAVMRALGQLDATAAMFRAYVDPQGASAALLSELDEASKTHAEKQTGGMIKVNWSEENGCEIGDNISLWVGKYEVDVEMKPHMRVARAKFLQVAEAKAKANEGKDIGKEKATEVEQKRGQNVDEEIVASLPPGYRPPAEIVRARWDIGMVMQRIQVRDDGRMPTHVDEFAGLPKEEKDTEIGKRAEKEHDQKEFMAYVKAFSLYLGLVLLVLIYYWWIDRLSF